MKQPDVGGEACPRSASTAILSTPDEFTARIKIDIAKWANVIRTANIKVE